MYFLGRHRLIKNGLQSNRKKKKRKKSPYNPFTHEEKKIRAKARAKAMAKKDLAA